MAQVEEPVDWEQPSHPGLIEVRRVQTMTSFASAAHTLVSLPPGALFARLTFPPLVRTKHKAYSTIQLGRDAHAELHNDLRFVNHSCNPSLEFDVELMEVRVARGRALQAGDELTFFYPSSEWDMAQPFDCHCGAADCRGRITGAKDMDREKMHGLWLNPFIEELLKLNKSDKQNM